jgi:sugar phosphate isomerase/epimerase
VVTSHIHDNHGDKDEHLLPYAGTIDWPAAFTLLKSATQPLPFVVELKDQISGAASLDEIQEVFDRLEKDVEESKASSA